MGARPDAAACASAFAATSYVAHSGCATATVSGSRMRPPQFRIGDRQMVGVSPVDEAAKPTPVRVLPETASAVIC